MLIQNATGFQFGPVADSSSVLASCMMYRTYDLDGEDAAVLLNAFDLFMILERHRPVPFREECRVCLIVSDSDDIVLTPEARVLGQTASFIFLFMNRSRKIKPLANRVAIVLEELLHCYYLIRDEWEVKELAMLLLQSKFSDISLHGMYPRLFDEKGHRISKPDS